MAAGPENDSRLAGVPWVFVSIAAAALVIQALPGIREWLIYDRGAIAGGQLWRIWTGHLVHFGWPHFIADAGLLVILGWPLQRKHARFSGIALVAMPAFISAAIFLFDVPMERYAGLSALNLGMLLYLAVQGWQRNWMDWFWPAVLVIYAGELILEIVQGGRGGGMIRFDDPDVRVATSAHLAGTAYALGAWTWNLVRRNPGQVPNESGS